MHVHILYMGTVNLSRYWSLWFSQCVYIHYGDCELVWYMWYWQLGNKHFELKKLAGLLPRLELLAVFGSDDTVVGTYTVGHALLWTEMLVCEQANISLVTVTELHSIAPNYAQTTRLHMQALASLHSRRHASTGTSMGCVTPFWQHTPTPHMPALWKGFGIAFDQFCTTHSNTKHNQHTKLYTTCCGDCTLSRYVSG